MFALCGPFVYRFRWATLIASVLLLGASIVGVLTGATFAGNGGFGADLPAGKANKLINDEIHFTGSAQTGSSFELIFSSANLTVDDAAFQSALENAVTPLSSDPRVTAVMTPYTAPAEQRSRMILKDSHRALVTV